MPANQLFADWVTGDLITADKLNQMKNDLVPWANAMDHPVHGQMTQLIYVSNTDLLDTIEPVGTVIAFSSDDITLSAGDIVVLHYGLMMYANENAYVFARMMYSEDGGSTWTAFGTYSQAYFVSGGTKPYVSGAAYYAADADKTVRFGVSWGNASGADATIYTLSYKQMLLQVFRGLQ